MFHSQASLISLNEKRTTQSNSVQEKSFIQNHNATDLSSYNIMSNIFYKAFENNQQKIFSISYLNQKVQIEYQMMCFNSI